MATRRKMARSAIRRVKRHASKNVRHKLKTHRRKHRKIVMRGGADDTYHVYIYSINILDPKRNRRKVKCMIVQKKVSGAKDDLFLFWPSYTTKEELDATLKLFIDPDKIAAVSSLILPTEKTPEPEDPLYLPSYLKIVPLPKKGGFIERSSYNPSIFVVNIDDATNTTVVDSALKDDFDREVLKSTIEGISTNKPINPILFQGEYNTLISKVKELITSYSKEYREFFCSKAAERNSSVSSKWCM